MLFIFRSNGRYQIQVRRPQFYDNKQTQWHKGLDTEYEGYGTISSIGENDEAISYAKQAGEAAILQFNGRTIHVDFVPFGYYKHLGEAIAIGFVKSTKSLPSKFQCDVTFELKHSYFQRQHEALSTLPHHVIEKLLPNEYLHSNHPTMNVQIRCCSLLLDNYGQKQALKAILAQDASPIIIAGPFGTGKTRVLARATYELFRQRLCDIVLICTHHQVSADTFIEYFDSLKENDGYFRRIKIVRVATKTYRSQTKERHPDYYVSVHQVHSKRPQVIVCTLGLAHHLKIRGLTHIFIDEAAQTRETEAIIPLQHAERTTRIVLAGDHCQVYNRIGKCISNYT